MSQYIFEQNVLSNDGARAESTVAREEGDVRFSNRLHTEFRKIRHLRAEF
jgi:hypothetical protein